MAMQRRGQDIAGRSHGRPPNPGEILARMRGHGQPPVASRIDPYAPEHEYGFLAGTPVDQAMLGQAAAEASRCGVTLHEVLLAAGCISQLDYAAAAPYALLLVVISLPLTLLLRRGAHEVAGR